MENKVKKVKFDYAAIIREFEMYGRGRSLRQFCDESNYTYANNVDKVALLPCFIQKMLNSIISYF